MSQLLHPAPAAPSHATSLMPLVVVALVLLALLILGTIFAARR